MAFIYNGNLAIIAICFLMFVDETESDRTHPETDDEGIEKDSGDCDDDSRRSNEKQISLDKVLKVSLKIIFILRIYLVVGFLLFNRKPE